MSSELAFVGDVHGNVAALTAIVNVLVNRNVEMSVFLGDYIDKGTSSSEAFQYLIDLKKQGSAALLMGNHEEALLRAIDQGDLTTFLKIGGAATIRSYLKRPTGPDVLGELRNALPPEHLEELREQQKVFANSEIVAAHVLPKTVDQRFRIGGHTPVGQLPRIESAYALIDTGCGSGNGRLTAFLWPSKEYVQVDNSGTRCASD